MASWFSAVSEPMQPTRYECFLYGLDWQRRLTPKPGDIFEFSIGVLYHYSNTTVTPLLYRIPFQYIHCQSFFQEGQHFLLTLLSHPLYYTESLLHEVTNGVVTTVRRMLPFGFDQPLADASYPDSETHQPRVLFRFRLEINLFYDVERAVMEESMQDFRMIPASKEAIQMSLKRSEVVEKNGCCTICMEEFDDSDDGNDDDGIRKSYALPCSHVFHQQCIVSWLQTSHVCPLCRYPLPTAND